ncbi:MAG: DUF5615 family PIN-like protein [Truepera sp.]|nr:DUF5615 family PIN-like protein [Truepera sp.]
MRILFDQGTPVPLRESLSRHEVSTAFDKGWSTLSDRDLLAAADREGYDVLVTTDTNLKHQQNLSYWHVAVVVLLTTSWPRLRRVVDTVIRAIEAATPGSYTEVTIPHDGGPDRDGRRRVR